MRWLKLIAILLAFHAAGCTSGPPAPPPGAEAVSLLGKPLVRQELTADRRARLEANLAEAQHSFDEGPRDEANFIWLGRRLAYLGRFQDAIGVYSRGLESNPGSYRLLRHRGHRSISVRKFDNALRDLQRAAELAKAAPDAIEPDGDPGPANQPRSTDKSNIYYHLGLVHYLRGDFAASNEAFARREDLEAFNDDMLVSTTHWRYLALRRAGREAEARRVLDSIHERLDVLENQSYYKLCLMYKGLATPEATLKRDDKGKLVDMGVAYGIAAFRVCNGEKDARKLLLEIADSESWPSFGVIAAEADLARDSAGRR